MDLEYRYHYANGSTAKKIHITADELSDYDVIEPNYVRMADWLIRVEQSKRRNNINGFSSIKIIKEGNRVVYTLTVDEDVYDFARLVANGEIGKNVNLDDLRRRVDLVTVKQMFIYANAGYSQEYNWIGSKSKKKLSYVITPKEILDIIDNFE